MMDSMQCGPTNVNVSKKKEKSDKCGGISLYLVMVITDTEEENQHILHIQPAAAASSPLCWHLLPGRL